MSKFREIMMVLLLVISLFSVLIVVNVSEVKAEQFGPIWNPNGYWETPNAAWTIEAYDDISYENTKIVVNGNLKIEDDGKLTLSNVTLQMNETTSDAGDLIRVYDGGELNVINGSIITTDPITPAQSPDPYEFRIEGTALIENSLAEKMKNGPGNADGIQIYSDDVTISNSTIQLSEGNGVIVFYGRVSIVNSTIIDNNLFGLYLYSSSNCTITGNNISSNNWNGIYLENSSNNNDITHNKVFSNDWGIRLGLSNNNNIKYNNVSSNANHGIYLAASSNNIILGNNIYSNSDRGISLVGSNNKIGMNIVEANSVGIYLWGSSNSNLITSNHLANNTNYALYISQSSNNNEIIDNDLEYSNYGAYLTVLTYNNTLYHNNIKNNTQNNATDDGTNQWDNGIEGNWWGNNTNPTDSDGNGICDAKFYSKGFVDNYPLANEDNDRVLVDDPWFWFIQSGVNFAEPGWTVYATSSTYLENVTINKTLTVIGEDRNTTIINARGNDSVVLVDGTSYVNITGFTVTDSGSNVNDAGVELNNAQNCKITNSNISNNYFGVYVENSSNIIIENNIMSYNHDGVLSSYSSVVIQYNDISYNNHEGIGNINYSTAFIGNNTITHNVADGIAEIYYSNAIIDNNTISYNNVGIVCGETPQMITYNNITNNRIGIDCWWSNSTIHWNNIHNNTEYGVNNLDRSIMVNATNNWWGNSTGPYHPITNPNGSGDRVSDYVDYDPWETAPIDEAGPG